ncbi:MAG TPA: hypothetical protein VNI52_13845 [Sphingobacteriaceae bacterium]|nr:hypothetical protein [Sphingobacteriaceae bacterium]
MIKKPYLIAILFFIGVATYFAFSAKKESKENSSPISKVSSGNKTPLNQPVSGLNPAHGEPGHRCDLKVGDPLPSAGGTPALQAPSFKPAGVTAPASTNPTITPAKNNLKINPAHGQPGHRCDVKTGDPFPEPGQVAVQPAPAKQNVIVALKASPANAKLNPAHGQPGHRCDIQAGAPLPGN